MRLMPKDNNGRIRFCASRIARWEQHAAELGLTATQVTQVIQRTQAAQQALQEQYQAQRRAQSATIALREAIRRMDRAAASVIATVRAHAGRDPRQLTLASIPAPKKRSKLPPPGTPTGFAFKIDAIGVITITWKCKHPRGSQGTIYEIETQRDDGERVRGFVTGSRKFVDTQMHGGARCVTYWVRAQRGKTKSNWGQFQVNLGLNHKLPRSHTRGQGSRRGLLVSPFEGPVAVAQR